MSSLRTAVSDLTGLYSIFGDRVEDMPSGRFINADEMPEPYRGLLAHDHHMTVTMEEFHGAKVDVHVLRAIHDEPFYARKIYLTNSKTGQVVMYGIMRFNFDWADDAIKQLILDQKTPLGRILIEHNVLRRVSMHVLLRIIPNEEMRRLFGMPEPVADDGKTPEYVYGRLATIFCNNEPAVDLLEVSAPVPAT